MNLFSAVHLALAGLCLGLGVLHLAMWFAAERERGHRWAALTFLGFTFLDASIAGSSTAADGSLGRPEPWLWLTVVTPIVIPVAMAFTLWSIFERPLDATRQRLAWVLVGLNVPISIQIAWLLGSGALAEPNWEAVRFGSSWSALLYELSFLLVTSIWLFEAWRAIPSRGPLARTTLVTTLVVVGLAAWELLLRAGVVAGPTLIGVVGLPFAFVASASLVFRTIRDPRPTAELPAGSYRRLVRLATGGMGELWLGVRAGNAGFRRFVVIKRIRIDKSDRSLVERFLSEARIAARLHHPNIVSVYDLDRTAEGWSIVMEYLSGPSLWEVLMRCHKLRTYAPIGVVLDIAEQICRGLECAHSHGVMHRDVSPDNVIVTFDGVAKLLDFGIAKEARARAHAQAKRITGRFAPMREGQRAPDARKVESGPHTSLGGVLGKTQYLAPERLIGGDASPETDLFAVGLVLVQLLGAPIPAHGADLADRPKPVSQHRREVPPEVEAIVCKALASHPWARYRSAAAMAADLRKQAAAHGALQPSEWVRELFPREYTRQRQLDRLPEPDERSVAALFARLRPSGRHAPARLVPLMAPPFPQPSGEHDRSLATAVIDPRALQLTTPDPPTVADVPVADLLAKVIGPSPTKVEQPRRPGPLRELADDVDVEGAPTRLFMAEAGSPDERRE